MDARVNACEAGLKEMAKAVIATQERVSRLEANEALATMTIARIDSTMIEIRENLARMVQMSECRSPVVARPFAPSSLVQAIPAQNAAVPQSRAPTIFSQAPAAANPPSQVVQVVQPAAIPPSPSHVVQVVQPGAIPSVVRQRTLRSRSAVPHSMPFNKRLRTTVCPSGGRSSKAARPSKDATCTIPPTQVVQPVAIPPVVRRQKSRSRSAMPHSMQPLKKRLLRTTVCPSGGSSSKTSRPSKDATCKMAFNVLNHTFEAVADIKLNESAYDLHKPRKPPYQATCHMTRVLFEHKTDKYIVWVVGGKFLLMIHPAQLLQAGDRSVQIGNFINAYKLDRVNYMYSMKQK